MGLPRSTPPMRELPPGTAGARPSQRSSRILLVLVGVLTLALVAVSYRLVVGPNGGPSWPSGPATAADAAAVGGDCTAPSADATIEDRVRGDDDYEGLWPHPPGQKVTVYFAYGTLPARYANFVRQGAQIWSRSPCINAVAVPACPSGVNCSNVTVKARAKDDSDGDSDSVDKNGVRQRNTVTLYTDYQDKAKDSGALATTVHEMGHALGLMHRKNKSSVMYEDTINMDSAVPDATDYQNLINLYGGGKPPGIADGD